MTDSQVYVSLGGTDVLAGTLYTHHRRGTESATFAYAPGYLADPRAYALDPALPVSGGTRHTRAGQVMFGAFTDCAPDRWGRVLLNTLGGALAVADYFRLSDIEARRTLHEVGVAVSRWRTVAAGHRLSAREISVMEPAFAALRVNG